MMSGFCKPWKHIATVKRKKKVGINEGHHLYLSLSFNISIYTQQSYMEPENDALFSHWEQKKKKKLLAEWKVQLKKQRLLSQKS